MPDTLDDFTDQATEASDLLLDDTPPPATEDSITELRDFTRPRCRRPLDLDRPSLTSAEDGPAPLAIDARAHRRLAGQAGPLPDILRGRRRR